MGKKLKFGVIGCGGIACGKHIPSYLALGDLIEIVAICDILPEKMESAITQFKFENVQKFLDYKELLKLEEIDCILVCTPNSSHCEISVAALNAGKHVLCEKPMATSYAEACEMVEASKRNGKILTIGYQNRFRADNLYLKKECENNEFGEIYFAKALAVRRRGVPTWGVFLDEEKQGGGPLIDIGTHALDMALYMMDNYKPKYVVGTTYHKLNNQTESGNAWGDWDPAKFTVEDSAFGFVVMENGATIIIESSWALNVAESGEAQIQICGEKGGADMREGLRINGIKNGAQFITKPTFGGAGVAFNDAKISNDPSQLEAYTFVSAVNGTGKLTVTPEQAAVVTLILEGIYKSAKTGKPVYFN